MGIGIKVVKLKPIIIMKAKPILFILSLILCITVCSAKTMDFKTDKAVCYEQSFVVQSVQALFVDDISFEANKWDEASAASAQVTQAKFATHILSLTGFNDAEILQTVFRKRIDKTEFKNRNVRQKSARKIHYMDLKLLPSERSYLLRYLN